MTYICMHTDTNKHAPKGRKKEKERKGGREEERKGKNSIFKIIITFKLQEIVSEEEKPVDTLNLPS